MARPKSSQGSRYLVNLLETIRNRQNLMRHGQFTSKELKFSTTERGMEGKVEEVPWVCGMR